MIPRVSDDGMLRGVQGTGLRGLYGRPFLPLEPLLDLGALDAVHEEVCLALAQMPVDYTGGSHRAMGIMPPGREAEALVDYVEVIRGLDDEGFRVFRSLGEGDPDEAEGDPDDRGAWGEERAIPLSRKQMLWLKVRHGVYFPWKGYVELIPNRWWDGKADPRGKRFTRHAEALLPRTLAFVRALPFTHIGRCNIMGLEAHDHGTVHRDGDPAAQRSADHFITLCPAPNKRLYLWDALGQTRVDVRGRAYWFNDHDYHGVMADPFFRYSIRVDGVFTEGFLASLRESFGGSA
jgi:hypothetical protein